GGEIDGGALESGEALVGVDVEDVAVAARRLDVALDEAVAEALHRAGARLGGGEEARHLRARIRRALRAVLLGLRRGRLLRLVAAGIVLRAAGRRLAPPRAPFGDSFPPPLGAAPPVGPIATTKSASVCHADAYSPCCVIT